LTALTNLAAFFPGRGDIKTFLAESNLGFEVGQRFRQLPWDLLRGAQQKESQPGGRLWANAGEAFEGNDQGLDGFGEKHLIYCFFDLTEKNIANPMSTLTGKQQIDKIMISSGIPILRNIISLNMSS